MKGVTPKLLALIEAAGLPPPELEYKFAPVVDGKHLRLWRFDLAWPGYMLAVEIEGNSFAGGGRHGGAKSAARDFEKRAHAALLGWRVIPVSTSQATSELALTYIRAGLRCTPLPF